MNSITALQSIFPEGLITGQNGLEVNNLSEDCVPQNCKIVLAGYKDLDRIFYFVETEQYGFYLRVCKASSDSDYAKFAVVHGIMNNTHSEYGKFYTDTLRRVAHYVK